MFILMDIISDSAFLRKKLIFFFAVNVLCSPPEKPLQYSLHFIQISFLSLAGEQRPCHSREKVDRNRGKTCIQFLICFWTLT